MENQKENSFVNKFRLLNSQDNTEDINWSSSCSSEDYSSINDKSCYRVNKTRNMKRKRKTKAPKNISNLNITILDTSLDNGKVIRGEKSPILCSSSRDTASELSPILKPSQSIPKVYIDSSPTLTSKPVCLKSHVLAPKTSYTKPAVKVRKKLFSINVNTFNSENQQTHLGKTVTSFISNRKEVESAIESDIFTCHRTNSSKIEKCDSGHGSMTRAKLDLAKKVNTFFDSHFSSENTSLSSQNSISDILTPKNSTKTSDEIEILTCKTQIASNNNSLVSRQNSVSSTESSVYNFNRNYKKIRYKKDGLAFRLNNLLKKQFASLSLWQHERFLAANSNFVIPKGEFTVFRIKNVCIKYGCHLLEAVAGNEEMFLILINCCYVTNSIVNDTIFKLYEPYKVVPCNSSCKLIVNVTKFECSTL